MPLHTSKDKLNKKTLAEQVFDIIYNAIINGEIKQGEDLVEHQLSKSLQVSRTPIREAFNRLKAIGLVEGNSYSKVTVKRVTREEIDEVTDIRALLEIYIMEKAVENCIPQDIEELENILKESHQAIKAGDLRTVVNLSTQFHEALYRISGRKNAFRVLSSLRHILFRHRTIGLANKEYSERNYQSHLKIVQALKSRDKEAAVAEIKKHMQHNKEASMEGLNISEK